jgi:phage terminase small subunit
MKVKLSREAAAMFKRIQSEWDITDETGKFMLTRALECYDEMQNARRVLEVEGEIVLDRWGQKGLHPMCQRMKESRAHMLQCFKALNLDLASLEK